MAEPVTISERPGGPYSNDVKTTRHHIFADEPVDLGGADIGPTPYEYLCAALGACTNMTLRMYAQRKDWPLEHVETRVSHKKVSHGGDKRPRDVFTREITIKGELDAAQRARLIEIANKCPVHRTFEAGSEVITEVSEGAS